MARARATDESALVQAAARVFRRKGYRNSTIDDIAVAAGVSRPTVYSYAKSKRWLLDRIVNDLIDISDSELRADRRVSDTPHDQLRAVINTHVKLAVSNRVFYAILLSEEAELSPAARKRFRAWAHQNTIEFRELLEQCLDERRHEAGLDTNIAANLIVTMLTDVYRWYDPKGTVGPDQLTDQILTLLSGILDPSLRR